MISIHRRTLTSIMTAVLTATAAVSSPASSAASAAPGADHCRRVPRRVRQHRHRDVGPERFHLFEGAGVYRIGGTNTYLLMVEAIGSDGRRWYRSWTANGIDGQWTPLADTEAQPFARSNNVSFGPGEPAWTRDISHGELLRARADQTMTVKPCDLQMLYQGLDPAAGGDYSQLPWRLGLLQHSNSRC